MGSPYRVKNKTILVIGATGHQGRAVVRALAKNSDMVIRAFVRDPASAAAKNLTRHGAQLVEGDLDDRGSLEDAMKGVYGVFSYQSMKDGVEKEVERGKRVAHTAKFMEIPHLVYSSFGGADRNTGVSYFQSKMRIEEYIRELDLTNYTIIRPVAFYDNFDMGHRDMVLSFFKSVLKGKKVQMISVADVGRWVAHIFEKFDTYLFQELEIACEELTYDQIEAAYVKVEGKKPSTVSMPSAFLMGDMAKLGKWMVKEGYQADISFCQATIKGMLSFEQWLALRKRGEV